MVGQYILIKPGGNKKKEKKKKKKKTGQKIVGKKNEGTIY